MLLPDSQRGEHEQYRYPNQDEAAGKESVFDRFPSGHRWDSARLTRQPGPGPIFFGVFGDVTDEEHYGRTDKPTDKTNIELVLEIARQGLP